MKTKQTPSSPAPKWIYPLGLALLCAVGAYFRLARLGEAAMQMDNQVFRDICLNKWTFWQVFAKWHEFGGSHLPFPLAWTAAVHNIFDLKFSFATMILPSTFWGILTIPVAFAAGREFRGPWFGLLLAAILALDTIHIEMCRIAYYYVPVILGAFLSVWAILLFYRGLKSGAIPWQFHLVNAASVFFLIYSDGSAWPYAFVVMLAFMGILVYQAVKRRKFVRDLLIAAAIYAVLGIPVVVCPWGLRNILAYTASGETKAFWEATFWNLKSPWKMLWPVLLSYAWGTAPLRYALSTAVIVAGLVCCFREARRDGRGALLVGLMAITMAMNILALLRTPFGFSHPRIATAAPAFLILLALGLTCPLSLFADRIPRYAAALRRATALLAVSACAVWVWPAYLTTRSTGEVAPYWDIVRWADSKLPPGTLVLTERFFDPWNEFKVHSSTNVQFMSTVPNQIPEQYIKNRFRDVTRRFLEHNPASAYFETELNWEHPQIGPWEWPHRFFARRIVFTNEAGLCLHRLGLHQGTEPMNDKHDRFYLSVLYYSLPEDVLRAAAASGKSAVALWGQGWRYIKTQDYRDWRMMGESAAIDLHNVTSNSLSATVILKAVAAGGNKQVALGPGRQNMFPNGQIVDWQIPNVDLPPGHSRIVLRDPAWARAKPQIALLAESVSVVVTNAIPNVQMQTGGGDGEK